MPPALRTRFIALCVLQAVSQVVAFGITGLGGAETKTATFIGVKKSGKKCFNSRSHNLGGSLDCEQEGHQVQTATGANGLSAFAANTILAGTVFLSCLGVPVWFPSSANAEVELSRGAITIETSQAPGQSLVKTEVDVKSFLSTLYQNRNALKSSAGRIRTVLKEELSSRPWTEVGKEVLLIEGDVLPELKIVPPSDWQKTIKDVSEGKLNLIINGEVINVKVEDKFGPTEDEVIVRVRGFKGFTVPSMKDEKDQVEKVQLFAKGAIRKSLDKVGDVFDAPFPFGQEYLQIYFPNLELKNGEVIIGGTGAFVTGSYVLSYNYYRKGIADAEAAAMAKREATAERKRKAAEAAKEEVELRSD